MALVVTQCVDAFAQGQQRRVDVTGLLQTVASVLRPHITLRTGQITEGQSVGGWVGYPGTMGRGGGNGGGRWEQAR